MYILVKCKSSGKPESIIYETLDEARMNADPDCDIIIDQQTGENVSTRFPTWNTKEVLTNKKDAASVIAQRIIELLSMSFISDENWNEIKEFAEKHNLPFSQDVTEEFISQFSENHPYWHASAATCW